MPLTPAAALRVIAQRGAPSHGPSQTLTRSFSELADECAEAYVLYGRALMALFRAEDHNVFAVPLPTNAADDEESSDANSEDVSSQADDAAATSTAEVAATAAADSETPRLETGDQPGAATASGGGKDDADDAEPDNLQIAWESFECARVIYSRHTDPASRRYVRGFGTIAACPTAKASHVQRALRDARESALADVHTELGQHGLEQENYAQAMEDFRASLQILKELREQDPTYDYDRKLAEMHYLLGRAQQLARNWDEAVQHYHSAIRTIIARIGRLFSRVAGPASIDLNATAERLLGADVPIDERVANFVTYTRGLLSDVPNSEDVEEIRILCDLLPDVANYVRGFACGAGASPVSLTRVPHRVVDRLKIRSRSAPRKRPGP